MKRQLNYEVIRSDAQGKLWKVTDSITNEFTTFLVSSMGEISFEKNVRDFPYSEMLSEITRREGRKLCISVSKANEVYKKIIERTNIATKVPYNGVSFQMYYLNP